MMSRFFLLLVCLLFSVCGCDKENPDPGPTSVSLALSDAAVVEGDSDDTQMVFKLKLSGAYSGNIVVNYAILNGTAVAGQDFKGDVQGNLVIPSGKTEAEIVVLIIGDKIAENEERFEVLLLNPVGAVLGDGRATGVITDNDGSNPLNFPTGGYSSPTTYVGRSLVWADEFNGNAVDSTNWIFEIGTGSSGWGNNELQYYRVENTYFYSGSLVIEARKEAYGGSNYTSSRLITKGKQSFKFGRIDIRAALPEGQGIWPALWMLGSNISQVSWPACGEIDIMELVGNLPGRVYGSIHFGANVSNHQYTNASYSLSGTTRFSEAFHVFSIEWEQDRIRWYVDDVLFYDINPAALNGASYPFNNPFFFVINVAVGGNWPGSPDASTNFPQRMFVDYIRVFQ